MRVKWVSGMWDLLTIYGKNKVWQLLWDRLKWKRATIIVRLENTPSVPAKMTHCLAGAGF